MSRTAPASARPESPRRDHRLAPLADIGVAPENLRFDEPPDDGIDLLAATIKAAGQLQPLTVRPGRGRKERPLMALDGRRRLLGLGRLLEAGDIGPDYPVSVYVETEPGRQAAAALLTNTAVPVHVADVIAAIGRMLASKLTLAAMAAALGYSETEIRRLAALAGLPAVALAALKAGRITLKQARLLARLPDAAEQADLARAALDGHGFQEWRVVERLEDGRVTARDRRCALVDAAAYGEAGGRTEADLFGERDPVLLDPEILTRLWTDRVDGIAARFEAEGFSVHVTAGPAPDLGDDLEPLGYVYGRGLSADAQARRRALRETSEARIRDVEAALAAAAAPEAVDALLVEMIRARIAADQAGGEDRLATALVLSPAAATGVEVRCYGPPEPETDGDPEESASENPPAADRIPLAGAAPDPEVEGVTHALHALTTDVATRGLARALADEPAVALTVLIARLFTVLVLRPRTARGDSALALSAAPFGPPDGRVIEALDGEVRARLDAFRSDWEGSERTVIGWAHALSAERRGELLAALAAIALDLREPRTTDVRRSARGEAAEIEALCGARLEERWTPDAVFLTAHPKALLVRMLGQMGVSAGEAKGLGKPALVERVSLEAQARRWAPESLSWYRIDPDEPDEAPDGPAGEPAYEVTPEGEAALAAGPGA